MYLTDDVFLYRFTGLVTSPGGQLALLEDCYLLDVVSVPLTDLRARALRVVTPERPSATSPLSAAA